MQYRILGKTGLKVSAVGFGGIPIQRIDARGTRALMERLVEKGVNYIDTARGYTVSESYLGEALSGGLREKFILATKSMSRGYADMARDIGISLSNLRTDYIDLYQLHNIKSDADFELAFSAEGAVAAIQDAIRAGKVGHLGATAHSVDSFERLLSYPEIETIMFPYNIVESQGEALMERAAAQNVGVIAMKPLAGGNITDGTLAMRYILQNKTCTLAIPGMATLEEIEQNTTAAEQDGPLTPEELAACEAMPGFRAISAAGADTVRRVRWASISRVSSRWKTISSITIWRTGPDRATSLRRQGRGTASAAVSARSAALTSCPSVKS